MPGYNSPDGNQFSEFVGIVVEDKPTDSRIIKVYLKELIPFVTGNVAAVEKKKQVGSDLTGTVAVVTTSNYVEAKYIGSPNRRYPPDVRKNEQVRVWKYADADEYYWDSLGRDDNLRGPERLNFSVSGAVGPVEALTDENTYFLELDTLHKRRILLRTSKANGEKYAYLIMLNADNSKLVICDDADNEILIESELPRVRLRNRDGSLIDLAAKNILSSAPEDYLVSAGRQVVYQTPLVSMSNKGGDGAMVWAAKNIAMNLSDTFTVNSPCIGLNGAAHTDTLVATQIQSSGYSTGDPGSPYESTEIDVEQGTGTVPGNSPNRGGGGADNRHCAAWEQVSEALFLIAECLENSQEGCPNAAAIRSLATASKMMKNRGE